MKLTQTTLTIFTVSAVLTAYLTAAQAQFSLSLQLDEPTVKLGAPIIGKVILTNKTEHDIEVYSDKSRYARPSRIDIQVRDSQGRRPKPTIEEEVIIGSGADQPIKPNEAIEFKVNVAELYHIDEPGDYTVVATLFDDKTKILVESNSVTVTVTR